MKRGRKGVNERKVIKKEEKKAVSPIVATLFIILLAIVVFAIISVVVRNVVSEKSEDAAFEGEAVLVDLKINKVVLGSLEVFTERFDNQIDIKVSGVCFNFITNDGSLLLCREEGINPKEKVVFLFQNNEFSEIFPDGVIDPGKFQEISVYPIIPFNDKGRVPEEPSSKFNGKVIQKSEAAGDLYRDYRIGSEEVYSRGYLLGVEGIPTTGGEFTSPK